MWRHQADLMDGQLRPHHGKKKIRTCRTTSPLLLFPRPRLHHNAVRKLEIPRLLLWLLLKIQLPHQTLYKQSLQLVTCMQHARKFLWWTRTLVESPRFQSMHTSHPPIWTSPMVRWMGKGGNNGVCSGGKLNIGRIRDCVAVCPRLGALIWHLRCTMDANNRFSTASNELLTLQICLYAMLRISCWDLWPQPKTHAEIGNATLDREDMERLVFSTDGWLANDTNRMGLCIDLRAFHFCRWWRLNA